MTRIRIAVIGLVALAVLTIFNLLLDTPNLRFAGIEQYDAHLAQVRAALPPSATIGYYTDSPNGDNALQEYYLIQYALAPVVVAKNTDHDLVFANLHNPSGPRPRGLEMLRDFGSGMMLLRKPAR